MATNIPIWAGSSSFYPGDTPFGLYDNDSTFQHDVDKVSDWCAKRLGYPITDIELQPVQLYACFEEAISEYGAQVNTYNIRDNMLNLYGSSTGSDNLSGNKVSANMGGIIELAEEYGVEAGSGGNVTYRNINAVGKQWIRRYALALSKEMLGYVRSKYSSIPIPNADVTLNGADLLSAGQTEKEGLITELKEILDTMSRQAQLERKQAEADSMQQQMNKIPLKIYIG